jgi:hypothetical protein
MPSPLAATIAAAVMTAIVLAIATVDPAPHAPDGVENRNE